MATLVDPTPAYVKLMDECGLDMVCHSQDEWLAKLDLYSMDQERRHNGVSPLVDEPVGCPQPAHQVPNIYP